METASLTPWLMSDFGGDLEDPAPAPPGWMARAACGDADPELFFPGRGDTGAAARRLCAGCPVRLDCLEYATNDPDLDQHGIFAGLSPRERREYARTGVRPELSRWHDRGCRVEGCPNRHRSRGLCEKHVRQERRREQAVSA